MMYCWGARPDGSRYNPARLPSCVMLTATTNMEGSALSSMSRHIRLPVLVALVAFTSAACGGRHSGFVAADPADIEQSPKDWIGQKLRIPTKDAVYDVYVTEVDSPFVIGYDYVNGFHPSVTTHISALEFVTLDDLKRHALDDN